MSCIDAQCNVLALFVECTSEAPIGEGDRHHVATVQGREGECHGEGCGKYSSSHFFVNDCVKRASPDFRRIVFNLNNDIV